MRIGLYCNWKVKVCADGGFYINSVHARYIQAFLAKYDTVYLLSNISSDEPNNSEVRLIDERLNLIQLPGFKNYITALKYIVPIAKGMKELSDSSGYIYVRTPEPLCWLFLFYKYKCVINYHFTSNPLDVILKQSKASFYSKYLKYIFFLPEYYLNSLSAFFNKSSCNGPSVLQNTPFFLRGKLRVLIENTVTERELSEKKYSKRSWGGTFKILCVSRLQEAKGLCELISTFSAFLLKNRDLNIILTIIGDGPLKEDLQKIITRLNINDNVKLQGHVQNGEPLNSYYRQSHILINPSLSETGPRVVLEAMSEGCVCVSNDVGYVRYIYGHDLSLGDLIIKNDFSSEFDGKLRAVLANQTEYDKLSMSSYVLAKKYSLENFIDNIFEQKEI